MCYGEASGQSASELAKRLTQHLQSTGLMLEVNSWQLTGGPLLGKNGPWAAGKTGYIGTQYNSRSRLPLIKNVEDAEQHSWVMDAQGKLHPVNQPHLCLTARNPITLSECDPQNTSQRWQYNKSTLALRADNGQCVDTHDGPNAYIALYGCTGGWNQQWEGVVYNNEPWFSFTQGKVITQIIDSLSK